MPRMRLRTNKRTSEGMGGWVEVEVEVEREPIFVSFVLVCSISVMAALLGSAAFLSSELVQFSLLTPRCPHHPSPVCHDKMAGGIGGKGIVFVSSNHIHPERKKTRSLGREEEWGTCDRPIWCVWDLNVCVCVCMCVCVCLCV